MRRGEHESYPRQPVCAFFHSCLRIKHDLRKLQVLHTYSLPSSMCAQVLVECLGPASDFSPELVLSSSVLECVT